ncbi:MAG: TolC family protein [Kiritimatiellae bacterium]|nr:TolC family protein [Kiritimatiellia bacterium]
MHKSIRSMWGLWMLLAAAVLWRPACVDAESLELTLDQVVQSILYRNPDVEAALLEWRIAERGWRSTYAAFEPQLFGDYTQNSNERENTTLQQLSQRAPFYSEHNREYGGGVEGLFMSGAKYRLGYTVQDLKNNLTTNDLGGAVHEWEGFAGLSVAQPLLKGGGLAVAMAEVWVAKEAEAAAFHRYRKELMVAISRAESSYWNLAFAQEKYRVAQGSMEIAHKLVKDAEERREAGKMSELELLRAKAGLAERASKLADSRQTLREAATQLRVLMANSRIPEEGEVRAGDSLVSPGLELSFQAPERPEALRWAMGSQADYLITRAELHQEKIRVTYMRNQRLPQLDMTANYGWNGLGESVDDSLDKIESKEYPAWGVGLQLRVPLGGGVRERHEFAAAKLRRKMAAYKLRAVEHEIRNRIGTLIERIHSLAERIANSRIVIRFYEQLLSDELKLLEGGQSNSRRVYEAEEELAEARVKEFETASAYREAVMQLAFVRGTLLLDRGFERNVDGEFVLAKDLDPKGWTETKPYADHLLYVIFEMD